jgi:hypothetical protein
MHPARLASATSVVAMSGCKLSANAWRLRGGFNLVRLLTGVARLFSDDALAKSSLVLLTSRVWFLVYRMCFMSGSLNQKCRSYGLVCQHHTFAENAQSRASQYHDHRDRKDHVLKMQRFMRSGYQTPLSGDFILHSCVTNHLWYAVNLFLAENCYG